jgi:hypothetical protein
LIVGPRLALTHLSTLGENTRVSTQQDNLHDFSGAFLRKTRASHCGAYESFSEKTSGARP